MVNRLVNALPVELHIPGYQYCGPGTRLNKRLARGDRGINPLDAACKEHDIAYAQHRDDLTKRHEADKVLEDKARARTKSSDATFGEKAAAWTVANTMKIKRKMGMGVFDMAMKKARQVTRKSKEKDVRKVIKVALKAARQVVKGKRKRKMPSRIIPIPKTGGVLPFLVPLFAGLSAVGSLAGGAAGIAKAVNAAAQARKELVESKRHNRTMEAISLGRSSGSGLYLRQYRKGLGLYLKNCRKGR